MLSGAVVALGSTVTAKASAATKAKTKQTPIPTCKPVRAPAAVRLRVVGNRVLNANGDRFIPYGLSIAGGLQDGDHTADWTSAIPASDAEIQAAPYWHANTIRLSFAEANIFNDAPPGQTINTSFLDALCAQVRMARSEGDVVVLVDQTEFPDWSELNPTARTEQAWKIIGQAYANQWGIIFDLYNEPRLTAAKANVPSNGLTWAWTAWLRGATVKGTHYVGMQTLVNQIRARGEKNIIWLAGPFLNSLARASHFQVADPDHNLVWEFHHPVLPVGVEVGDVSNWQFGFEYLTAHYPVVDGEWSQYAAAKWGECYADAPQVVPIYFRYLRQHGIGLLAWGPEPGSLVAEKSNARPTNETSRHDPVDAAALEKPNQMFDDWACNASATGEGAGKMVLNYFKTYSGN